MVCPPWLKKGGHVPPSPTKLRPCVNGIVDTTCKWIEFKFLWEGGPLDRSKDIGLA